MINAACCMIIPLTGILQLLLLLLLLLLLCYCYCDDDVESTGCESCQRLEQHSSQMGNLPEDYFHSDVTWKVQLPLLS